MQLKTFIPLGLAAMATASPIVEPSHVEAREPSRVVEPRAVVTGTCKRATSANAADGVCYQNQPGNGWQGNCDNAYPCTADGNWCSISTAPGGSVVCS